MKNPLLENNTAGLEEQLGCSGVTLFTLAFTSAIITIASRLLFPRVNVSRN